MTAKIALAFALACIAALITAVILAPHYPNGHPSTGIMIFIVVAFTATLVSCFGLTLAVMGYFKERTNASPRFGIPILAIVLNALIFSSIVGTTFWLRHKALVLHSSDIGTPDSLIPNTSGLMGPE